MEKKIGTVSHFFDKVSVAAIKLNDHLKVGDSIHIKGSTTDSKQPIESMQITRQDVPAAKAGDEIGIKVLEKVRNGDEVYRIIED